jgi:hypothetical protein
VLVQLARDPVTHEIDRRAPFLVTDLKSKRAAIELTRSLAIASTINGNRCDQSYSRRVKNTHPRALSPDQEPIAVVLDFVNPLRANGHPLRRSRQAGYNTPQHGGSNAMREAAAATSGDQGASSPV